MKQAKAPLTSSCLLKTGRITVKLTEAAQWFRLLSIQGGGSIVESLCIVAPIVLWGLMRLVLVLLCNT